MITDVQRICLRTHGTLIGRIFLGLLFLVSGIGMFQMMGVSGLTGMLVGMGIPAAGLIAVIVLVIKIFGGAALILGYKTDIAAIALIVFTLLTVVLVHNTMEDMTAALKNLSIIGGLLYVLAYGAGDGWKISK